MHFSEAKCIFSAHRKRFLWQCRNETKKLTHFLVSTEWMCIAQANAQKFKIYW